jgi:hypothetical protein
VTLWLVSCWVVTLVGESLGCDTVVGESLGFDTVVCKSGCDTVFGESGCDTVVDESLGCDTMFGESGCDTVFGELFQEVQRNMVRLLFGSSQASCWTVKSQMS